MVTDRLTAEERQRILLTCNQPEFAALPPEKIVPPLADRGLYIGSERSFYRVLHAHSQVHRRGRARPPQEPKPVPRLRADDPNQVWSLDTTYLPTSVCGVWLYLYLVIDVWSRKVVAWDVADREDSQIAADLVSRASLRERISRRRRQSLIHHADNGNAIRAATLEVRLEELGVHRSFSRPRVTNNNPSSESLFRMVKYRPDHPTSSHKNWYSKGGHVTRSSALSHSCQAARPCRSAGRSNLRLDRRRAHAGSSSRSSHPTIAPSRVRGAGGILRESLRHRG